MEDIQLTQQVLGNVGIFFKSVTTGILDHWQPQNQSRLLEFLGYTLIIITYINCIWVLRYTILKSEVKVPCLIAEISFFTNFHEDI